MNQPTKASAEKKEDCAFTWNSWIDVCKLGLPKATSVLVISTSPGNTLLHQNSAVSATHVVLVWAK